jgi:histidyl-tRNA synthetase
VDHQLLINFALESIKSNALNPMQNQRWGKGCRPPTLILYNDITMGSFKSQFKKADKANADFAIILGEEEFEDTKGAIRIRISKKNRQHNDQKKKYKRTNNTIS